MLERLTDTQLLSLCIWGESRGEPIEGQLAVAHVVLNRVATKSWYGKSIQGVILKPLQFSCFNASDPNFELLSTMAKTGRYDDTSIAIAALALSGYTIDPTDSATHYHAKSIRPAWSKSIKMHKTVQIGNHIFYREAS